MPFFRIKTTATKPLPPIFVLTGGPGDNPSILEEINGVAALLHEFSSRSDIVVIEQRGNGLSNPNLLCSNTYSLPLDEPLSFNLFAETYRSYIQNCSKYWQEKNRDLLGYNVISMADDIEDVRKLLGYEKIRNGEKITHSVLDSGYYDQVHFNKEFKFTTLNTPSQFLWKKI